MVAGSYKTIAAVKSWFFENNLPYFSLYVGTSAAGTLVHSQTKTQDIQKAWEVLENNLRQMSEGTGGTFFILSRREKESDGTANLKDTQGPRCVASLSPNPDINMSPYAAMATPPSVQKGIMGLETADDLEAMIQKRVNAALVAEREKAEAKKKIEDLEDAIQGLQEINPTAKYITAQLSPAIGQLLQMGTVLLAQKFGMKMPDMAAMAGAYPPPQYEGEQNTDTEEQELDYDSLEDATTILRKQGVENPEELLLKAAKYAAMNPSMITMLQNA